MGWDLLPAENGIGSPLILDIPEPPAPPNLLFQRPLFPVVLAPIPTSGEGDLWMMGSIPWDQSCFSGRWPVISHPWVALGTRGHALGTAPMVSTGILHGSPLGHHPTSLVPFGITSMVTAGWDRDVGDKNVLFHALAAKPTATPSQPCPHSHSHALTATPTATPSQPRPQSNSSGSPSQHTKG